jgi:hypothetical protein
MTKEEKFNVIVNHAFGGWHHVQKRTDIQGGVRFWKNGSVSTFDFDELTRLVVAAHAVRCRVEIESHGPRMLRFWLSEREDSADKHFYRHHPGVEDLEQMGRELADRLREGGR